MTINLIPPKLKKEKEINKISRLFFAAFFIVNAIIAIGAIGLMSLNQLSQMELESSNNKIAEQEKLLASLEETSKKVESMNQKLEDINKINKEKTSWSQIITEIAKDTPEKLQIKSLSATNNNNSKINLTGSASSRRDIALFKEKLENSNYFENVIFSTSSFTQETEDFNFNLSCELKKQ